MEREYKALLAKTTQLQIHITDLEQEIADVRQERDKYMETLSSNRTRVAELTSLSETQASQIRDLQRQIERLQRRNNGSSTATSERAISDSAGTVAIKQEQSDDDDDIEIIDVILLPSRANATAHKEQIGEDSDIEIIEEPSSFSSIPRKRTLVEEREIDTPNIKRPKKEEIGHTEISMNVVKKRSESPETELFRSTHSVTPPADDMSLRYPSSSVAPQLKYEVMYDDSPIPEASVPPPAPERPLSPDTQGNAIKAELPEHIRHHDTMDDFASYPTPTASNDESDEVNHTHGVPPAENERSPLPLFQLSPKSPSPELSPTEEQARRFTEMRIATPDPSDAPCTDLLVHSAHAVNCTTSNAVNTGTSSSSSPAIINGNRKTEVPITPPPRSNPHPPPHKPRKIISLPPTPEPDSSTSIAAPKQGDSFLAPPPTIITHAGEEPKPLTSPAETSDPHSIVRRTRSPQDPPVPSTSSPSAQTASNPLSSSTSAVPKSVRSHVRRVRTPQDSPVPSTSPSGDQTASNPSSSTFEAARSSKPVRSNVKRVITPQDPVGKEPNSPTPPAEISRSGPRSVTTPQESSVLSTSSSGAQTASNPSSSTSAVAGASKARPFVRRGRRITTPQDPAGKESKPLPEPTATSVPRSVITPQDPLVPSTLSSSPQAMSNPSSSLSTSAVAGPSRPVRSRASALQDSPVPSTSTSSTQTVSNLSASAVTGPPKPVRSKPVRSIVRKPQDPSSSSTQAASNLKSSMSAVAGPSNPVQRRTSTKKVSFAVPDSESGVSAVEKKAVAGVASDISRSVLPASTSARPPLPSNTVIVRPNYAVPPSLKQHPAMKFFRSAAPTSSSKPSSRIAPTATSSKMIIPTPLELLVPVPQKDAIRKLPRAPDPPSEDEEDEDEEYDNAPHEDGLTNFLRTTPSFDIYPPPNPGLLPIKGKAIAEWYGGAAGRGVTYTHAKQGRKHVFISSENCPHSPAEPGDPIYFFIGHWPGGAAQVTVFLHYATTYWTYAGEYECRLVQLGVEDFQDQGEEFKTAFVKKKYLLDQRHYARYISGDESDTPFAPITPDEEEEALNDLESGHAELVVGFLRCHEYNHGFAAELQKNWRQAVEQGKYEAYESDGEDEDDYYW